MLRRRQPPTSATLQAAELNRMVQEFQRKRNVEVLSPQSADVARIPHEVGLQLTRKCNLRCDHCFQWGEKGHYRNLVGSARHEEIPLDLIKKILVGTRANSAPVYAWGGEPLAYGDFGGFLELIARECRSTVICTNGIGLNRYLNQIVEASEHLTFLVSLDGFQSQHDNMRSGGTFNKTLTGIRQLIALRQEGNYRGNISVATVISDGLVDELFEYVQFISDLGVDTLHLNFPWYISTESAFRMDKFFEKNFSWLKMRGFYDFVGTPSWYCYPYRISSDLIPKLMIAINKLYKIKWNIRVKIQPLGSSKDLKKFLDGSEQPLEPYTNCRSMSSRLSVLPNGRVTTCKLFPEFTIGDLNAHSIDEIWNGDVAHRVWKTFEEELSPVCTRCVQLYQCREVASRSMRAIG